MIEVSITDLFLFAWGGVMTLLYFKLQSENKRNEEVFGKTLYLIAKKRAVVVDDGDSCHLEEFK